jgi:hypothetical protein
MHFTTRCLIAATISGSIWGCGGPSSPATGSSTGATVGGGSGVSTSGAGGGTSGTPASSSGTPVSSGSSGVGSAGRPATTSGSSASGSLAASGTGGSLDAGGGGSSGTAQDGAAGVTTPSEGGSSSEGGPPTGPTPSAGCGTVPNQPTAKYVQYNIQVTTGLAPAYTAMYTNRNYYVWLPTGYDPTRAYTTVFLGTGCGGNGMTVLPMQNVSKGNAILVGLSPVGQCFMTSAADSPEIAFFDAALKDVESSFCVDQAHVFIAGFSSGSWLANLIGCARAGIVRGQGNATGGLPPVPTCTGPIAAMLAHDEGDTTNAISGGEAARDRILKINGCSTTTIPYNPMLGPNDTDLEGHPIMCVQYQGCPPAYPVVWCPTTGQGHSDQVATGLSVPGFWNFWEALP